MHPQLKREEVPRNIANLWCGWKHGWKVLETSSRTMPWIVQIEFKEDGGPLNNMDSHEGNSYKWETNLHHNTIGKDEWRKECTFAYQGSCEEYEGKCFDWWCLSKQFYFLRLS